MRTFDRSYGRERKVDVAIAYEIGKDLGRIDRETSEIVLITGDKDFEPVVQDLVAQGFNVCVAFWQHAAEELKRAASEFKPLDPWLGYLANQEVGAVRPVYAAGVARRNVSKPPAK